MATFLTKMKKRQRKQASVLEKAHSMRRRPYILKIIDRTPVTAVCGDCSSVRMLWCYAEMLLTCADKLH